MDRYNRQDGTETITTNTSFSYRLIKRIFDITAGTFELLVFFPLLLLIKALILIKEGRPVFFTQERAGLNGKPFKIYKFRTMVQNASEYLQNHPDEFAKDGAVHVIPNDFRITKTGAFLRKTDLDELPQLFNIIKGEMSFVGPRPFAVYESENLTPYQRQRLLVKPGLICYWQLVKNEEIHFDERIQMDLNYVQNASIKTDLIILLKTIPAILNGKKRKKE